MTLRVSRLVRLLGMPLVCLAMFSVGGGQWAVLQSVAWAHMLWSYSKNAGSFVTGVEMTFSGDHPCSLCRIVKEGRQKEEKLPATIKVDKKDESFLLTFQSCLKKPDYNDFSYLRISDESMSDRSDAPPSPVPRRDCA